MKKCRFFFLVALLTLSGVCYAQDNPGRTTGGPDRGPGNGPDRMPGRPPVPKVIRENTDFQQWTTDFQAARASFKARLVELREALKNAEEAEKDGIRDQIREQMKLHRAEQNAFRKRVRILMREVRESRVSPPESSGD